MFEDVRVQKELGPPANCEQFFVTWRTRRLGCALSEKFREPPRTKTRYPEFIAVVYEGLGEREQALQRFEKAYTARSMHAFVIPDPLLEGIRSNREFRLRDGHRS